MSDFANVSMFTGRICNDLELKYTPAGKAFCSFRLAVDNPFQKGEDGKPQADFFSFVAWEKDAETLASHAEKGRQIGVLCRARNREWTDANGNKVKSTEFVVNNFKFLGQKPGGRGEG
jgi:single-strand DNA-binding protein